jgi:hypothetical protein
MAQTEFAHVYRLERRGTLVGPAGLLQRMQEPYGGKQKKFVVVRVVLDPIFARSLPLRVRSATTEDSRIVNFSANL